MLLNLERDEADETVLHRSKREVVVKANSHILIDTPTTPHDLARETGRNKRAVRRFLRANYAHAHMKWAPWLLSHSEADYNADQMT